MPEEDSRDRNLSVVKCRPQADQQLIHYPIPRN